jgi:nucleoside-diphosphate kinase
MSFERTLVIMKPDAVQRNLLGEIITRFERKGLKIICLKMIELADVLVEEHYMHHKDKPFFGGLKNICNLLQWWLWWPKGIGLWRQQD